MFAAGVQAAAGRGGQPAHEGGCAAVGAAELGCVQAAGKRHFQHSTAPAHLQQPCLSCVPAWHPSYLTVLLPTCLFLSALQADLRSQGTTDTALSMARALQVEVNFWQSKRSMQCKNRNGTQRVSRRWLRHERRCCPLAFNVIGPQQPQAFWRQSDNRLALSVWAVYCAVQGGSSSSSTWHSW